MAQEGSLECYLAECGVGPTPEGVDRVVEQAVAWRVTPAGRSLIDRRRRSRVERNVRVVVEHLLECGVPPGECKGVCERSMGGGDGTGGGRQSPRARSTCTRVWPHCLPWCHVTPPRALTRPLAPAPASLAGPSGVGAILSRSPELMLCKPTTNDRWDRRAVELSAFLLLNGHCNVPEVRGAPECWQRSRCGGGEWMCEQRGVWASCTASATLTCCCCYCLRTAALRGCLTSVPPHYCLLQDWEESPELEVWVKRQRIARAAGQLSEERLSILVSMGFEFGEVAQLTEEWEHRFDQVSEWWVVGCMACGLGGGSSMQAREYYTHIAELQRCTPWQLPRL